MADPLKTTLETILVIDRDDNLVKTIVTFLENADFRVLSANSAASGIKLAEDTKDKIDLLLCEVDLSNMSGTDVGKTLKKARPDIHVMMMSGQENGNLLILNYGWAYIRKELIESKMVQMVTDVLHSPDRSQLGDEFDSSKDKRH